ncbi:MAG: transporter substrate-binding domain-containing protein [Gammaproteobacteria bacterium]|nr:transporter substrate-binding domain-containing protein [Gammaproteobacteria bacterium]
MLCRTLLISFIVGLISIKSYASKQLELTICHEANSYPPYIYAEEGLSTGLLVDIIEQSAHLSSIRLTLYSSSWLRCQKDVQSGRADALFAMVKTKEREKLFQFPPDEPDVFFLWHAQYPVFYERSRGFDYENYIPNKGIAAPLGYVVKDLLKKKNWLSPYPYEPSEGLPMVAANKLDGYVVERLIGEKLLEQLKISNQVEATEISLLNTNWYVPFNRQFYQANKPKVDLFWSNIAIARDLQN